MTVEEQNAVAAERMSRRRPPNEEGVTPTRPRPDGVTPTRPRPDGAPRPNPRPGTQPSRMNQTSDYQPTSGGREGAPARQRPAGAPPNKPRPANGTQPQGRPIRSGKPEQTPKPTKSSGGGLGFKQIALIGGVAIIAIIAIIIVMSIIGKKDKGDVATTEGDVTVQQVGIDDTLVQQVDPNSTTTDYVEPEPFVILFQYLPEEVKQLRAAGYTGDEIEAYQIMEKDVQELLDEAAKEQQEYVDKFLAPLYDTTSDAYKENLRNTWLGLDERSDVPEFVDYMFVNSKTQNLDFEKVPVRGNQIYLKVYLDDVEHNDYFFMNCDPRRFMELGDSGNIVVTYQYIHPTIVDENGIKQEDQTRMFIIDAYEVTVTD